MRILNKIWQPSLSIYSSGIMNYARRNSHLHGVYCPVNLFVGCNTWYAERIALQGSEMGVQLSTLGIGRCVASDVSILYDMCRMRGVG